MEKSKALIFGVLVDIELKSGETLIGFIDNTSMRPDPDFIKLSNKKVAKGVRSNSKRIKKTSIASIAASKEKTSNF